MAPDPDGTTLVSGELADQAAVHGLLDAIRDRDPLWHPARIDGDLLKIHGENRTVIYRIMEQAPRHLAYVLRWPG